MPELQFIGKEFVYNHHLTVPYRPLVIHADKSVVAEGDPNGASLDDNLIIQGDNLHALKALLPRYAGKVDCIFIDPPYNTGNEGWAYNDNVNSPLMRDWLTSNPVNIEDMLRHDKWCAMMLPRLRLLWELLSPTGTICICIDDNEMARLRCLCEEAFGESEFLGAVTWKTRNTDNRKSSRLSVDHEYILFYSRLGSIKGRVIDRSGFVVAEGEPEAYVTDPLTGYATAAQRPRLHYTIVNPATGDVYSPDPSRGWRVEESTFSDLLSSNRIWWPASPESGKPRKKRYLSDTLERMPESTFWSGLKGQTGADEVDKIMGSRVFDFPKSLEIVEKVLDLIADDHHIILDSFAGSGTTAHAVLNLNAKDGGSRRFILVECEDYADTLTAERVRRVIKGYPFKGTQRETLYEKKLTWTALQKIEQIMAEAKQTAEMHEGNFDTIETKVDEGTLKVIGIRKVEERAPGLGGGFTYCTLGDPLDIDKILTGDQLPSFENIAGWLVHTAFGTTLPSVADNRGEGLDEWYVGETDTHHVWVMYRPDRAWLQSRDASLTLALAEQMAKNRGDKPHQVFAPAKFVGKAALDALKPRVEFAPLPFALYRLERA